MNTTLNTAPEQSLASHPLKLTFFGIVRSEWIKFWSLRSTYWSLGVGMAFWFGICFMAALTAADAPSVGSAAAEYTAQGVQFAQLIVVVLGVLCISGEYATGMIYASFSAAPKRLPVLAAKGIVLASVTFVLSLATSVTTYAVTGLLLESKPTREFISETGEYASVPNDGNWLWEPFSTADTRVILGCALYLTVIVLFAFAAGAMIRKSAGAIAGVLGIILVLGMLIQFIPDVGPAVQPWLPAEAGMRVFSLDESTSVVNYMGDVIAVPGPWEGFGILVAYTVAALVAAGILTKRRDA